MSWHTPSGDRYLVGPESRAFRAAMRSVIEMLELQTLDCSGTMLAGQPRKSLLHLFTYVGQQMLRHTSEVAPLNAWTEGAVAIIFRELDGQVDNELFLFGDEGPDDYSTTWREYVWNATDETTREEFADDITGPQCEDADTWHLLIDILRGRVLWDADWEFEIDSHNEALMQTLGIDHGYYNWHMKSYGTNKEAIRIISDLCGFRCGEWEGQELS